jgi:ribosome-associated heat shock protein Hsp15
VDRQRIDKWLWHARVVRTRSAAAGLAASGHVRINGQRIHSPSRAVRGGDVVTVALQGAVRVLKVSHFAERRGSASDARTLWEDVGNEAAAPKQAGSQSRSLTGKHEGIIKRYGRPHGDADHTGKVED